MKKLFYSLFAFAALAMTNTSCSQDELENGSTNANEAKVSFNIQLENAVGSRAVGDGTTATSLQYAVYKAEAGAIGDEIEALRGTATMNNLQTTITLTLVKGQTYNFLFWAQSEGGNKYYTLDYEAGTISVKYDGLLANDEARDAFFKVRKDLKITGPINETIVLKRPFAQINVGTTIGSLAAAATAETDIAKTSFKVTNVSNQLNLYTGAALEGDDNIVDVTFGRNVIIESNKTDEVGDLKNVNNQDYEYLALNYILVPDAKDDNTGDAYGIGEEKGLVNAELELFDEGGNSVNKFDIPNVPVQRNWRTNIIGEIMNADVTFTVIIEPSFDDDHNYFTNEELDYVLQNGGTYTLTDNMTINEPLTVPAGASAVLDLNGHTLTLGTADRTYALLNNGGTLTINNGTIVDNTSTYAAIYNFKGVCNLNKVNITTAHSNAVYTTGYDAESVPGRQDGKPYSATLNINGGTYTSSAASTENRSAIYGNMYSNVVIKNATVSANHTAISLNSCGVELDNVKATSTDYYALFVACCWVKYTNCTLTGKDNKDIYADDLDNEAYTNYINGVEYTQDTTIDVE